MAIDYNAFGRVTLSGADAEKFNKQVTYGKPKKAAVEAAKRGRELAIKLNEAGFFKMKVPVSGKNQNKT